MKLGNRQLLNISKIMSNVLSGFVVLGIYFVIERILEFAGVKSTCSKSFLPLSLLAV
jgi:hypothetical protein